jgi:hypothetical protein
MVTNVRAMYTVMYFVPPTYSLARFPASAHWRLAHWTAAERFASGLFRDANPSFHDVTLVRALEPLHNRTAKPLKSDSCCCSFATTL